MGALPLLAMASNPSLSRDSDPAQAEAETAPAVISSQIMDKPYDEARAIVLDGDWSPVENAKPDDLLYVSREMYDKGFVEVDVCSPVGETPCKFYFKNMDDEYLEVITETEAYVVDSVRVLNAQEYEDAHPKFDESPK